MKWINHEREARVIHSLTTDRHAGHTSLCIDLLNNNSLPFSIASVGTL